MTANGFLAIWSDVFADEETDYLHWLTREHAQERLGVPGFRTAQRYEAIENLLECELNAGQDSPVSAGDPICGERAAGERQHCRAGGNEQGQVRDHQSEPDYSACRRSHRADETTDPYPARSAGVNVSIESYHDAR